MTMLPPPRTVVGSAKSSSPIWLSYTICSLRVTQIFIRILSLPAATRQLPVDRGEHERVARDAVDRAVALELALRTAAHEPVVRGAVEVQVRGLELELRLPGREGRALLVLRDEAEGGLAREGEVVPVRARRGVEPPATRDEPSARVVHDDERGEVPDRGRGPARA